MHLGDLDRHPVLVQPSEAVDSRSAEAGEMLLQHGHPRFQLAATLLTPMNSGLGVDDLADDPVGRTPRSMPEPTKSTLKRHRRHSSKMELTAAQNAAQTVIVEYLQATLILYAQWPGLATVK